MDAAEHPKLFWVGLNRETDTPSPDHTPRIEPLPDPITLLVASGHSIVHHQLSPQHNDISSQ